MIVGAVMPPTVHDPASPSRPRLAFSKARRLRRRGDFVRLQPSRTRVHTPHFLLLLGKSPNEAAPARLGVTVTRKVGSAVERNRVKRVVREAFRLDPGLLPDGVDLVVIAKDGAPTLGLFAVQAEWDGVRPMLQRRARDVLRGDVKAPARGKRPDASGGPRPA